MKKLFYLCSVLVVAAMAAWVMTSCTNDLESQANEDGTFAFQSTSADAYDDAAAKPVVTVSGTINSSNNHWTSGNVYALQGVVLVPNGVTLTIDAGTFIKAVPLTSDDPSGVLVVAKGGKINAVGTATNPIVFTSYNLLDNNASTTACPGDFGGVILLGRAPINNPGGSAYIEGLNVGNPDYAYGGTLPNDNSGIMQYVRIEYAGYELDTDIEGNGLTMGGVGNGTTLDHIQVSWGLDDSFEWFGGTVNASYLISYAPDDDNFDFDNGYVGTIRYALALANPASTHSTSGGSSDSNGIELDNNAPIQDPTFTLTPKTHPVLNNVTIVGTRTLDNGYRYGARIRRGGEITLQNSIITGYPSGFVVDADANSSLSTFTNNAFHGFTAATVPASIPGVKATGSPAATFGMGNPFYPANAFSGALDGRGAFASNPTWHNGWSYFRAQECN
ncbi:MAG: hypothetical protein BGO34_18105 [Bacteroidia bacterium 44-10]|nr:MAG: hypothetical protein BGO34_18105 [Bacteroidia bacterium 44-10]